ncbi:beta-defensin 121 [Hyaena hyaena]|uniref:beta-defensin 121 n=1 Tax=Hyaena hyaena TaxID=95912 RepID=UPI001923D5FB|nr:beta-defensin 121 [Hyaena hyaena]
MKLILLVLTVTLFLVQVTQAMYCWSKLGRCRTACKDSEAFHILCRDETKCCVNPKHVPVKTRPLNATGSLE